MDRTSVNLPLFLCSHNEQQRENLVTCYNTNSHLLFAVNMTLNLSIFNLSFCRWFLYQCGLFSPCFAC